MRCVFPGANAGDCLIYNQGHETLPVWGAVIGRGARNKHWIWFNWLISMPRFLLQCLNPLQRLITFGCLSNRSNSYRTLFICGLLFVVCIAYPSKLWGLGLGSFSIEIGTCPSLILSQVNACWEPFWRKKYFKFLCSSVTFWASHKHSPPAVLLFRTWARSECKK